MDTIILEYLTSYLHFFSSILWWGLTFFVVVILGPVNRNGSYSLILPRIHKFILPISTVSITSGLALTFININFDPNRLFNSLWVYMLILGGLFSIPVYLVILFRSKKRTIKIQFSKKRNSKKTNFLPFLLFALLSSTIFIMIFVTKFFS
ncbi:MAG TPA: hypothetical protein VF222_00375 [Nitrososphaeraceae archaeon]